ncbi:hypothetical protein NPS74_19305, partial [Cutibacterium acnes subsp. acnes]|nr:hypothetical protein [Cutibacterium acnes subsp. acnes]
GGGGDAGVDQSQLGRGARRDGAAHDPGHGGRLGAGGGGEPPQVTALGQSRHRPDGVGHPAVRGSEGEDAALGGTHGGGRVGGDAPTGIGGRLGGPVPLGRDDGGGGLHGAHVGAP